jgi:transposase-like protein
MSKKRTTTRERMLSLAGQWTQSGESQKSFCVAHGISASTLGYWLRQYRQEEESLSGFVALPVATTHDTMLEIHHPNGVYIKVPLDTDVDLLRTFLTPA